MHAGLVIRGRPDYGVRSTARLVDPKNAAGLQDNARPRQRSEGRMLAGS